MRLPVLLKLIRVANLPTAVADVLAGFFFITTNIWPAFLWDNESSVHFGITGNAALPGVVSLVLLCLAAMCLYSSGMADNDASHALKDTLLRKPRPIPRGDTTRDSAAFAANTLALIGVMLASLAPVAGGAAGGLSPITGGLAVLIVLGSRIYNRLAAGDCTTGAYRPPSRAANIAGILYLAGCRGCNIGLGVALGAAAMSASGNGFWDFALGTRGIIALSSAAGYFFLVTTTSLFEDAKSAGARVWLVCFALIWLVVLVVHPAAVFAVEVHRGAPVPWLPIGCVLAYTAIVGHRVAVALRSPEPRNLGMVVKWSIISWPLVLASMVGALGTQHFGPALLIAAMTPLCLFLGRYSHNT
jgi:hypothetical protein